MKATTPRRFVAALLTSVTATFLLVQVLGVGHAEESAPPKIAVSQNPGSENPSDVPAPAKPKRSAVKKVMPVRHFVGY